MTIKWACSPEESAIITKVLDRAKLGKDERRKVSMDLEAAHSNGTPLDFQSLLVSNLVDFWGDVRGISKSIDRNTGKLSQHFHPRCALSKPLKRKPS